MSNPKDPARRQRRNMPKVIEGELVDDHAGPGTPGSDPDTAADGPAGPLAPPDGLTVPPPPPGLPDALAAQWVGLWRSPVGPLLDPVSDYPPAARLFRIYALGARLDAQIDAADIVDTALVSARLKCATESRLIESQLGLSPRSRLALGLALLAGRRGSGGSVEREDEHDDAND